jgi:5-(carboxyamino)imidazole ribonucleotide mutase
LKIALLMGSDSDLPRLQTCLDILARLGIPHEARVLSAHRTPGDLVEFIRASDGEIDVYICAAGGAAHLAGVVSAHTLRPVIGIPMDNPPLGGLDALLSTVQMPGGVPVATVGCGAGGPLNAALIAARILALTDTELAGRLHDFVEEQAEIVRRKDERVRKKTEKSS